MSRSEPVSGATRSPLSFVRGGTSTQRSEQLYARRFVEAEERRNADAADRARAQTQKRLQLPEGDSVLLPGTPDGGVEYSHNLTDHPDVPKAVIVLRYKTRSGEDLMSGGYPVTCVADLIVGAGATDRELTLIFVCYRCVATTHKRLQDCQLRISQGNKYFEFKPTSSGELSEHHLGNGEVELHRSAGTIVESEPFRCPDCHVRMRIVNNTVRPD